jgi:DNA-binding transcriptional LysR family regulator
MRDDQALRAFRAIAEHGSFTRAAAALDVTASALSQTLAATGTPARHAIVTAHHAPRGTYRSRYRDLLLRIAPALNELDMAMDAIRQHGNRPRGTLQLDGSRA